MGDLYVSSIATEHTISFLCSIIVKTFMLKHEPQVRILAGEPAYRVLAACMRLNVTEGGQSP
jgi:hypothetical protein